MISRALGKNRALLEAPTVMASGLVPGEVMVWGSGPAFPAAATTTTPASTASDMAICSGSWSGRRAGPPKLRLITSIPSWTASSMAAMTAAAVVVGFTEGLPNTL